MRVLNWLNTLSQGCFLFFLMLICVQTGYGQEDTAYWSEYNISCKINDRLSLILNPSFRLKDNISELQYWESRQGVSYQFNKALSLNFHYLHTETKNIQNKWVEENNLELQPTYKWTWVGFDWSDRFRLEYRVVNGIEKWRYRNLIKVSRQITVFKQELTPYISEELFYDEAVDQMNQDRLRVGVSKKLSKQVSVNVFYQYKATSVKQDWTGENIIGTGLDLSF